MAQRERQVKPVHFFVSEDDKLGQKLYAAERKVHDAIAEVIETWMRIARKRCPGMDPGNFWTWGLPQALFDLLNSYQTGPAVVAARAFLDSLGAVYQQDADKAIATAVTWEEGAKLSADEEPQGLKPRPPEQP